MDAATRVKRVRAWLALIAGAVRGIPMWWRLGDCSFGIFGTIPLWFALREVRRLERDILQA